MSYSIPSRRITYIFILLVVTYGVAVIALLTPLILPFSRPGLQAGQVAGQDFQAPRAITFQSDIFTQRARETAARAVSSMYSAPDTSVARQQLEKLNAALVYINNVRADTFASKEYKVIDLSALEEIEMTEELAYEILALNDQRWQAVQQESIIVLEQIMRTSIREDRLEDTRDILPSRVSLTLTEEQVAIVVQLVEPFVVPTSFYDAELTEAARQTESQAVQPVLRTYQTGETIIQRGRVLKPEDIEALQALGLAQPELDGARFFSAAMIALLMIGFLFLYLRRKKTVSNDVHSFTLLIVLFLLFLFSVRLLPDQTTLPYLFPFAAYGMVVAVLIGTDIAYTTTVALAILSAYGFSQSMELTLYYVISAFFGILTLGRARRIISFILAALASAGSGVLTILLVKFSTTIADPYTIVSIIGSVLLGSIAAAGLAILLQFFLAQYLGMTTALHLIDISRPDHPLLHLLLTNAPGTYQHSLQVANLAEQAAERIGADPLLTRVGALYHDIGKAVSPIFYIENQAMGSKNPHTDMEPSASAQTIISHIQQGLIMARKHRLPLRIQDFISEHHGTMIARYQYATAVKAAGGDESKVDANLYRYPGPRPRSRETAILMLADGCEARVRAERPKDEIELRQIIKTVIDNRISDGQLDDTSLTLNDLHRLEDSFTTTLRGIYHPRIEYPKLETSTPGLLTEGAIPPVLDHSEVRIENQP